MARSAKHDGTEAVGAPEAAEVGDHERAAEKRRAAVQGTADRDRGYVDALLAERRGYVTRGLGDRVAQVDAELSRCGHKVDGAAPSETD